MKVSFVKSSVNLSGILVIFVNESKESGRIILKLRLLNKLSIEDMCHKLEINREDYMKLEKGEKIPSKEISTKLISIFNLKIENKL